MSAKPNNKSWLRRAFWAGLTLVLIFIITVLALRVFITTNSGARFIESQVNNRSFGAIERIEISGLSGDPLNKFALKSVKISDKNGVWITANELGVDWNPWALSRKALDINSVTANAAGLIRKPNLNVSEEPSSKTPFAVKLGNGSINAFNLDKGVMGQSAVFSLNADISTKKDGEIKAHLNVIQTDKSGDKLNLDFTRNTSGALLGQFGLNGTSGGTLANLLRAPDGTEVTGKGQLSGSIETGQGDMIISFNGAPKLLVEGLWSKTEANLKANIKTASWPAFDNVRTGLGNELDITAALNRASTPEKFDVDMTSSKLTAKAWGQLNPDDGLPKAAQISVISDNLGAILPLPEGFTLGAGLIEGRLQSEPNYRFAGDVTLGNVLTPYGRAASIIGPLTLTQDTQNQYFIDGNWVISDLNLTQTVPITLAPKTTLKAKAVLDTQTSKIKDIAAALTAGDNQLNIAGTVNYAAPSYDLTGSSQITLNQIGALPSGDLQSNFKIKKTADAPPTITAASAFKPSTAIPAPFDQLFQGGVNFDIDISPIEGGVAIRTATLIGETVKAAVSGRITDQFYITGEALLSAPFAYDPIELSGQTTTSFTLTGDRETPNLRLDASANKTNLGGYILIDARLRAQVANILKAPNGPLRLTAETDQGALDISANFTLREQVYIADNIALSWGDISASGHISKPASSPATGQLSLNLPEKGNQFAKADIKLMANDGIQGLLIIADAKNIAYQDWAFDSFKLTADGTLSSLSGKLEAKGQRQRPILERQFDITAPFTMAQKDDGSFHANINPNANYGNIALGTASPMTASYKDGDIILNAPLTLAGEPFEIDYQRQAQMENFTLKTNNLPMTLIPMSGSLADTRGRIEADITLSSSSLGSAVNGNGLITLKDWRGFDAEKGSGLSTDMTLKIEANRLNWQLNAQSISGFSANGDGVIPILLASSLAGLRLDMNAPASGQFTASGQAASILGLITPSDAKPSGQLSANLKLSGTATSPYIEGQVSGQNLRLEAPQLGTQLRNGRFMARFTNDTFNVSDVSVEDGNKGTITGQGQFKLGEFARPIGELKMTTNNFRALDRKDYEGTVSGTLGIKSTQEQSTITGDITLKQAEVKQFVSGKAYVVEIPVEEINKPKTRKVNKAQTPSTPINLDIRLRAPRRVFVRSRGLDVELSVDATLKGTLSEVEIYGDASVLRGNYKIAGKSLAFESGGITFDGKLGDARVNLTASTDTQNLSAKLIVKGTVAKPEIELSSSPERPQDEILSAILFGRSATDLSVIEAAQLAGALAQFSGAGGGFDLIGGLRDALGVGQLSIGVGQNGDAQITGGRYLAKNVYLQVFSGAGLNQTGALIDWEVRKNISLSSKIQADNDQSFSLKWKKDF